MRQLGLMGLVMAGCRPGAGKAGAVSAKDALGPLSATEPGTPGHAFLREIGRSLRGRRLRILTEDTPPSSACRKLVVDEFTELTGIEVEWLQLPLADVHARTQVDLFHEGGHHDIFYLDQSWLAQFRDQVEDLAEWQDRGDLAYPGWDYADFLAPLQQYLGMHQGRQVALPYDITLFIQMCRRDLFDKAGLNYPRTLAEYLEATWVMDRMFSPDIRGTVGQLKVGHYALLCHWSAWLWAHGGSFFNADGSPALDSEESLRALDYLWKLKQQMPPQVIGWDWHREALAFGGGHAAIYSSWAEFFPLFDDPQHANITGLAEPMVMPRPDALKPIEACGHGEAPGIAHQGGSGIALSRYSQNKEAAWVLMQWLTCPDITVRSSLLGGGASATRHSTFKDPRILAHEGRVGPGTTRHFPAMKDAIMTQMGTEPHHPAWPHLALEALPVELGRFVTGQQSARTTAMAMQRLARRLIPA